MVGMPLLNLGYALGGLTGGYNQAQTQAMQRAAQQLALQQAQNQMLGQRLLSQYLQSGQFKGFGGGLGGLGGAFNPANIQPAATGGATPSQQPPPPSQQQPPPADGLGGSTGNQPGHANAPLLDPGPVMQPRLDSSDSSSGYGGGSDAPSQTSWLGQFNPIGTAQAADTGQPASLPYSGGQEGQVIPLAPPLPSQAPASPTSETPSWIAAPTWGGVSVGNVMPGGRAAPQGRPTLRSATPTTTPTATPTPTPTPAPTPTDTSGGKGGGGEMGIQIGNQTIPLSQFFGSIDYGEIAKGIAKLAPPGTDQAAIYEAVVDLSKLAEGNRTQQQQAGLVLRELLGQQFKLVNMGQQFGEREKLQQRGFEHQDKTLLEKQQFADQQRRAREDFQAAQADLAAAERNRAALAKANPTLAQESSSIAREIRSILAPHQADSSIPITQDEQDRINQLKARLAKINNALPTQ